MILSWLVVYPIPSAGAWWDGWLCEEIYDSSSVGGESGPLCAAGMGKNQGRGRLFLNEVVSLKDSA